MGIYKKITYNISILDNLLYVLLHYVILLLNCYKLSKKGSKKVAYNARSCFCYLFLLIFSCFQINKILIINQHNFSTFFFLLKFTSLTFNIQHINNILSTKNKFCELLTEHIHTCTFYKYNYRPRVRMSSYFNPYAYLYTWKHKLWTLLL